MIDSAEPAAPSSPYVLANRDREAGDRFAALSDLFDVITFANIAGAGIRPGWKCWEVGAGGPSVPTWLAGQVGPSGSVLATDVDVRWLTAMRDAPFDVAGHDVAHDHPPAGPFDLVHARLVLVHEPGREAALRRMVSALRPGGWLLVEDFDPALQPLACLDPVDEIDFLANRVRAAFLVLLGRRGVDLEFGRKLPRLFRESGLVDVSANASFAMTSAASRGVELANVAQTAGMLVDEGLVPSDDVDRYIAALRDGTVGAVMPPMVAALGRRP